MCEICKAIGINNDMTLDEAMNAYGKYFGIIYAGQVPVEHFKNYADVQSDMACCQEMLLNSGDPEIPGLLEPVVKHLENRECEIVNSISNEMELETKFPGIDITTPFEKQTSDAVTFFIHPGGALFVGTISKLVTFIQFIAGNHSSIQTTPIN